METRCQPPGQPSAPFPRQRNEFWSRLIRESFLQDIRQPGLAFGYPSRVVLAYRVFVIAKKIGDICNRYSSLPVKSARKYVGTGEESEFPQTCPPVRKLC